MNVRQSVAVIAACVLAFGGGAVLAQGYSFVAPVVPRTIEVGTVVQLLRNNLTYAFGPVHVTSDDTRRMATWPRSVEGGIVDLIMSDEEYRRVLVAGLGAAYYVDVDGHPYQLEDGSGVVPIPNEPNAVRVLLRGGEWRTVTRARFDEIQAGYLIGGPR